MPLELVTGYQGVDHVTAEQIADFQRGIYGDAAVLNVGSKMNIIVQTANQVTITDGIALFDGREVSIGYGESVNLSITSGTQGMKRNDLIVLQYTRDETTGVESAEFKVVPGTPNATTAADPSYTETDIRTGVFTSQKPFARIRLVGTAIDGIDRLVSTVPTLPELVSQLSDFNNWKSSVLAGNTKIVVVEG